MPEKKPKPEAVGAPVAGHPGPVLPDDTAAAPTGPELSAWQAQILNAELDALTAQASDPHDDDDDDEGDDDEQDEPTAVPVEAPPAHPSAPRVSRRGFLSGAAALAGVAAVSGLTGAAGSTPTQPVPGPAPEVEADAASLSPEMAVMMTQFLAMMAEREERMFARVERRLAELHQVGLDQGSTNGVVHQPAELASLPGQYPPSWATPPASAPPAADTLTRPAPPVEAPRRGTRMVAFIPKEDPYNPRQTTFRTWTNGRELRAKRGQVMILTQGHGIDLARNGHGNCVDIAAMQGMGVLAPMEISQHPDYARPDAWNGLPLTNRSSIPIGA